MVAGRTTEPRTASVTIPSATVSNRALAANVATLTTSAAHNFVAGEQVVVAGVDATFNGTYSITSVPSATTFTYSKTAADVASVASTGTALSTRIIAAVGTFSQEDVGRSISGTGIPANAKLASVQSDTTARLSVAATAAGTVTATLGVAGLAAGYVGWSPETAAEASSYTVAANNAGTAPPDRITDRFTGQSSGRRARG